MDIRPAEAKSDGAQKGGTALLLAALVLGVSAAAGGGALLLVDAAMAGPVAVGAAALAAGVALAVMAGLRGSRDRSGELAAGALVDALAAPALIASPSGVPLHANTAYAVTNRALGFARLVSPLRWAAGDPAAAAGLYAALKRAKAGEAVTTPLGSPQPGAPKVAVRLSPVAGGDGGVAALLFVIEDTAGDKVSEPRTEAVPVEAVGSDEALFSQLFRRMPVAVGLVTGSGEVHEATPRFWRLLDRGEADAGGRRPVLEMIAEPDRAAVAESIARAAAGEPSPAPIDASLCAETPRDVRLYVAPFPETDGAPGRAILYAVDTTEQRALEMQFDQSQKMQAVGQLAGGVAHDFNNILTAIIGFSDLLLMNHRPTDPSFQDIMNIKQNANRAAGLVKQLLAFSRRQTLRPSRLRLPDVLADLSVMLDRLLGEKVTLTVVHGRDLWPVLVDQSQLEQVITNLSVNARDAMPDGGRLTIRTANVPAAEMARYGDEAVEGDHILIEVTDTGTGIPPDVLAKIYEPFFSTKEVGQGTGLGLSTVYGIVKQTGGTIHVDSRVGEGTTFQVLLPRAGEVAAPVAVAADAGDAPSPGAATAEAKEAPEAPADPVSDAARSTTPAAPVEDLTGSATILLVEDEDTIRAFASRALEARGYRIHAAATGEDALAIARELDGRIDLLVSDVVMPEMDGPTLAIEVKALNPAVPIIFMSGYAEDVFSRTLPSEMEFGFLPKPFSLKALATAVKEALEPAEAVKH